MSNINLRGFKRVANPRHTMRNQKGPAGRPVGRPAGRPAGHPRPRQRLGVASAAGFTTPYTAIHLSSFHFEGEKNIENGDSLVVGNLTPLSEPQPGPVQIEGSAIIVEPRKHAALKFVIENMIRNLPPRWEVIVVHGPRNDIHLKQQVLPELVQKYSTTSSNSNRQPNEWTFDKMENKVVRLYSIPNDNLTIPQYNRVLTSPVLWNLPRAENVLIFQTDSMIFSNFARDYKHFANNYTYSGSPFFPGKSRIMFNGGLSLRKKSASLHAIQTRTAESLRRNENEDIFYMHHLFSHPGRYKLPSMMEAARFSAQIVLSANPLGVHKCWINMKPSEYAQLCKTHPEVRDLQRLQHNLP